VASVGWGGEHRHVLRPVEQRLKVLGPQAVVSEAPERVVERADPEALVAPEAQHALPLLEGLFRDVGQGEIGAEGANDQGQGLRVEAPDECLEAPAPTGVLAQPQAEVALAQGLDRGVHVLARVAQEHVPEQAPEQPDPAPQLLVVGLGVAHRRYPGRAVPGAGDPG
jgi:hypothetical protein